MTCVRTGAQVYLDQYREYAWCDIYQCDNTKLSDVEYKMALQGIIDGLRVKVFKPVVYLRIAGRSFTPINGCDVVHANIHSYSDWFDNGGPRISTLISTDYTYHGYTGKPIKT